MPHDPILIALDAGAHGRGPDAATIAGLIEMGAAARAVTPLAGTDAVGMMRANHDAQLGYEVAQAIRAEVDRLRARDAYYAKRAQRAERKRARG